MFESYDQLFPMKTVHLLHNQNVLVVQKMSPSVFSGFRFSSTDNCYRNKYLKIIFFISQFPMLNAATSWNKPTMQIAEGGKASILDY